MAYFSQDIRADTGRVASTIFCAENVAYIRPVKRTEGTRYVVCSEDGRELATFSDPNVAYYTALQHDLEPVHVH